MPLRKPVIPRTPHRPPAPADAKPKLQYRVIRQGWCTIALTVWLGLATLFSQASLMLLILCIWLSVVCFAAISSRANLRHLEVRTRLPEAAVAKREFSLTWLVTNGRRLLSSRGLILAAEVAELPIDQTPMRFLPRLRPRRRIQKRAEMTLPRRGMHQVSTLLKTSYPLGLLEWSMQTSRELLVYPRLGHIQSANLRRLLEAAESEGSRQRRSVSIMDEYHSLREFRDGDNYRSIHWPTSARRGELMVREYETRIEREVVVLVDPWLPDEADEGQVELLELVVSLAASLCRELCHAGQYRLGLAIAAQQPVTLHGSGSDMLLRRLLRELALLQGTRHTSWPRLLGDLPRDWKNRMLFALISARLDALLWDWREEPDCRNAWSHIARRCVSVDVSDAARMAQLFQFE